jgi:two-component system, OmpR family, response regulator
MCSKPRVLVVDDEELSQEFLKFFLLKKFEVYTCGSVDGFYNLIDRMNFDLILMDISLRDYKNGIELTRELKQSQRFNRTPVFILTAHNTTKEHRESLEAGADQFLVKPIEIKDLMGRIEGVLNKYIVS